MFLSSSQPAMTRLLCVLFLTYPPLAAQAAAAPVKTQAGAYAPFVGRWEGALEYQDYGGSGRVKVPVKLEVKQKDATSSSWDFVYDDFGRTVPSFETHSLTGNTYQVVFRGKSDVQKFTCAGFAALFSSGVGKAVLLGSELENGKNVEVRRTITLTVGTLTTLKETRLTGGKYAFRNQSVYTRAR